MTTPTTQRLNELVLPCLTAEGERPLKAYEWEEIPNELLIREVNRRIKTGAMSFDLKWHVARGEKFETIHASSRSHMIVFNPTSPLNMRIQLQRRES